MSIRWKILAIFLVLALVPMMVLRWSGRRNVREMGETMADEVRDRLNKEKIMELARLIEISRGMFIRQQRLLESFLQIQALEIEKRLAGITAHGTDYRPDDFDSPQIWQVFGKTQPEKVRYFQERLQSMPDVYRQLAEQFPGMPFRHVSAFTNGLQTLFPAPDRWPDGFDFFGFDIYKQAFDSDGAVWTSASKVFPTESMVFMVAMPLRVNGKKIGVTSIVIPVDAFLNSNECLRMLPGDVVATLIQLKTGEDHDVNPAVQSVFRRLDNKTGWIEAEFSPESLLESDRELFQMMTHVRNHESKIRVFNTSEYINAYGCMEECRNMMVLKVPLKEAINEADALKERIMIGTRRLIADNTVILWVITALASVMAFIMSGKVTGHIRNLAKMARRIAEGNLDERVRIKTGDELESLAHDFNEMTDGLKKQIAMQSALAAAREIQQNFIPQKAPRIEGLDIAGQSIYCDATGGDYFDYMDFDGVCCRNTDHIFIAVGDVSGHGIQAALLMASVRALLRSRVTCPGDLGEVITDVNRLLVRDTNHTGQFMTLFYMDIHPKKHTIRWVRAGHEPGLLYIPEFDSFENLNGEGVALGIMESAVYRESHRNNLMPGQLLFIGTDGIWETQAPDGRMFGKERLKMLIRQNAGKDAQKILNAVTEALVAFRGGMPMEDDVTLVVVKMIKD